MKKIVSILLCVLLVCFSAVSVYAAEADLSDEGKTVFTIDDWTYSVVSGSTNLQVEQYVGSDTELYVPRIVNDRMVVALVENCFSGNKTVKHIHTSSPLWTVGAYAFLNCSSLESFECNFALKEIGGGAFNGASSLKSINLEDSVVTVIRPLTFLSSGIEDISLPESCTEIMSLAFAQCDQLSKIYIPKSVTAIAKDAFSQSDNVVIHCYTDSYAHQYAVANDIPFVLVDAVSILLGDADDDGFVTVRDVTTIQRLLSYIYDDPDGMIALRGDITDDGLDINDATLISRYLIDIDLGYPINQTVTRILSTEV